LLSGSFRIDRSRRAVCAFVNVRYMLWWLVIADNVLPGITRLTQHSVPVVIREATDALDG
jgi:hypothetical protein